MNTTPEVPSTSDIPTDQAAPESPARRRFPRGRTAIVAGAVVAVLAVGGAGFGAGYAVGDSGSSDLAQQTSFDGGERGFPDGDRTGLPPGGPMGQMPGDQDGDQDDSTGEAPDFDGDGQPDTDSDTDSDSNSTSQS